MHALIRGYRYVHMRIRIFVCVCEYVHTEMYVCIQAISIVSVSICEYDTCADVVEIEGSENDIM